MLTLQGGSGPVMGSHALMNNSVELSLPQKPVDPPIPTPMHMWIVTGPAGCGKSTVAASLAGQLSVPFIEGDNLHPTSNRKKMETGIPLNDEDRWDWLVQIREAAVAALDSPSTAFLSPHRGVVITCSALKHKYRDVIRVAAYNDHRVNVHFIYLHATEEVLTERVKNRKGHFMAASMVHSQFAVLEEPDRNECRKDVLSVDCSGEAAKVEADVMLKVKAVLFAHSETSNGC